MSALLMLSLLATLSSAQAGDDDGVALDDDEFLDLEDHSEEKKKKSSGSSLPVDSDDDDDFIDSLDNDPPPSKDPPARRSSVDDDELDAGDLLNDEDDFFKEASSRKRVTAEEAGLDDLDMDLGDPDMPRVSDMEFEDLGDPDLEPMGLDDPDEDFGDLRGFSADLLDEGGPTTSDGRSVKLANYGLNMDAARALDDNFDLSIVDRGPDAVIIELPFVVTTKASEYLGEKYWVVATFFVNGSKAGEQRHIVHPTTIAPAGPTIVWIKGQLPVPVGSKGEVEVQLVQEYMDGAEEALFTKTRRY